MQLLFYSKNSNDNIDQLYTLAESLINHNNLFKCQTIEDVNYSLRHHHMSTTIALLFVANQDDLLNLLSLQEIFSYIRLIIVLPTRDEELIALAHRLRPRFLTFTDENPYDLKDVLKKLLHNEA
ncbi:MAG: hypothetical protein ACMUIP_14190 [bacterium]